ncbi:MAG: prepilin peptidase [Bdellovibrio sp.]|nr:prepilin peptidase [Bdellovibrio sp.]
MSILFGIFGLLIGSFINVLIYRLPLNKNIVFPRSACPHCHAIIPWYFNIPVLSFLFLRGKCAYCRSRISLQYPLVELINGIVYYLLAKNVTMLSFELLPIILKALVFSLLVAHVVVDLRHQLLPDGINIFLAIFLFTLSLLNGEWLRGLYGMILGLILPLIVTYLFYLVKGVVGLGGGDIKLFGALGLFLGPLGVIQNIFVSCLLGSVVGIVLILTKTLKRDKPIPFGPFIILVAITQIYFPSHFQRAMAAIF